jgi:hypothetical protein
MAKELWEDEARDRFVAFLREEAGCRYRTAAEDVLVPGGKNFDYLLEPAQPDGPGLALEMFRLTPRAHEIAESRVWSQVVAALRAELLAKGVAGYMISTPHFHVTRPKRQQFVREAADRIARAVHGSPDAEELEIGEYAVTRLPSLKGVEFVGGGSGGAFSAEAIASDCLRENIAWKNDQLNVNGCTRALLIVNWNPLVDSDSVLLACSRFNFEPFRNIDQVFFEVSPANFRLVYDRSVCRRFEDEGMGRDDLQNAFAVSLIEARLVDRDRKAFRAVRTLNPDRGSLDWLGEDSHSHLLMLAQDLLKDNDIENALWIIRRLRNSPEPAIKVSLCWALHSLVLTNRSAFYAEVLDVLEEYARDEDGSLRASVPIPLTELAARLRCRNEDGTAFMSEEIVDRVRGLAFGLLDAAAGELATRLSWVFFYIRDVSEAQARQIVATLVRAMHRDLGRIAALIIYYAIYRERQYRELARFDATWFKNFLRDTLREGHSDLRRTLAWSIWRGMSEDMAIEDVLPYLHAVPEGRFEGATFGHLYRIIRDRLEHGGPDLCRLFVAALQKEREYLLIPENNVWHFEEFFETVRKAAKSCGPEVAAEIRNILQDVSEKLGVSRDHIERLVA